jgi:hypothetical protein
MDQEYLVNLGKAIGRMEAKLDEALDPARSCDLVQKHERIFNGVTGGLVGFAITLANLIRSL